MKRPNEGFFNSGASNMHKQIVIVGELFLYLVTRGQAGSIATSASMVFVFVVKNFSQN